MDECLGNKYVLVNSENFEEFLAHIGVGYFARKVVRALRAIHSLSRNEDGTYTFAFTSPVASSAITFTPGVQFVEEKPYGDKVKAMITIDGNIMTHTQTEDSGRTSTHVREFHRDRMITRTTSDGFNETAIREYNLLLP